MGQYDYQGTPASRMYDWLVTRNGDSLTLGMEDEKSSASQSMELEDLEYIRGLVERDRDYEFVDPLGEIKAVVKEAKAKSDKPPLAIRDHYENEDGTNKIPEPLGPTPPPTRRHLDKDGRWVEGDKEVEEIIPTQEEIDA